MHRLHRAAGAGRDLLARLADGRWELFAKASDVHTFVRSASFPEQEARIEETGVAVRVTSGGRTGFAAASGLEAAAARHAIEGALASALPQPHDPIPPARLLGSIQPPERPGPPAPGWASFISERLDGRIRAESRGLLTPVRISVHEGRYAWILTNGEGAVATHQSTACSVTAELAREGWGASRQWVWVSDPAALDPEELAIRITDRGLLGGHPGSLRSGLWDVLLASEVAAQLLAALAPLFVAGHGRGDALARLLDREGRLASPMLTLVDDRSGEHGPLTAPCDGEGLPARRITILEEGVPRHRIASYGDALSAGDPPNGGARRVSYRDPPVSGLANLMVITSDGEPPGRLLEQAPSAVYLTRLLSPVAIDAERNLVRMLASGLRLAGSRPESWHPLLELRCGLGPMLRSVDAVGTDLEWYETAAGYVGAPSLLIRRQPVFEGG